MTNTVSVGSVTPFMSMTPSSRMSPVALAIREHYSVWRKEQPMRMRDKVALVTGAGSGIGRATAVRFAAEGAGVACVDVAAAADETAKAIQKTGGQALALACDVTDQRACARLVGQALDRFRRLTTLVNSAGVRAEGRDAAPAPAEWQRVLNVNLTGTYLASRACLPALSAGGGSITNLASIFGLVGGSLSPAYAASK